MAKERANEASENRRSERGNKSAQPGNTKTVEHIVGSSGPHGVRFPVPDHPDHSDVDGDGGIGCSR